MTIESMAWSALVHAAKSPHHFPVTARHSVAAAMRLLHSMSTCNWVAQLTY